LVSGTGVHWGIERKAGRVMVSVAIVMSRFAIGSGTTTHKSTCMPKEVRSRIMLEVNAVCTTGFGRDDAIHYRYCSSMRGTLPADIGVGAPVGE
jgi:hypothetical protein